MHAPLAPSLEVEWLSPQSLPAHAEDWRALAARALVPNVFYEPSFALAAAPRFGGDLRVALVWSRTPARRLVGLFPLRREARRFGVPLPILAGWTHPFAPLGAPLVDKDMAEPTIAAWLAAMQGDRALPPLVLMPYVPDDGALADALDRALARHGMRQARFGAHRRALLQPPVPGADYIAAAVPPKKRKELRRVERRLDEHGTVSVRVAQEPEAVSEALQGFLALEASGWKGRAGTAALSDPQVRTFMGGAVGKLAAEGKAAVHTLMSGKLAIASAIVLRSADRAWFWKVAYDEERSRYSPGVLLTLKLTDALLADPAVTAVDSCATPDHSMIDHLWRERLALSDRLILMRPEAAARFAVARQLEGWRRSGISAARRLRDVLRRQA